MPVLISFSQMTSSEFSCDSHRGHPKNVEASQRMLRINSQEELGRMSSPLKRGHLKLEIKTRSDAPRDADKLSTTSVLPSN
jgi:hypothetical protein